MNQYEHHVINAFACAEVVREPYLHLYVQNVFPWVYYDEMVNNLPPPEAYSDKAYENRAMADVSKIDGLIWKDLCDWMLGEAFCKIVCKKLEILNKEVAPQIRLVRDTAEYSIKVHTDIKSKIASLLFYLPTDMSMLAYGTSVYVPKELGFTSDGNKRFEFEHFEKVKTAPFAPNTVFGFKRAPNSFHGVEKMGLGVRNVLLYNLYA